MLNSEEHTDVATATPGMTEELPAAPADASKIEPPLPPPAPAPDDATNDQTPAGAPREAIRIPLRVLRKDLLAVQVNLSCVASGTLLFTDCQPFLKDRDETMTANIEKIDADDETKEALQDAWAAIHDCPLIAGAPAAPGAPGAPGSSPTRTDNDLPRLLAFADAQLRSCLLAIARVTVPEDWQRMITANGGLAPSNGTPIKSGDGINFDARFLEDLPNEDDRTTLFTEFANKPGALLDGWIDLDQRQIYRYSQWWLTQLASSATLVAALLLTGVAVANAWRLSAVIPGWTLGSSSSGTVFGAWLAALAGVGFHMMIDSAKSAQAQGQKVPNMSLRQVPLWIEVHLGILLAKLFLTLVALFTVAAYVGVRSLTPLYGLLVGYSLDSVLGLIQDNVGQQSSAFIAMLKQKTGGSNGTTGG